MATVNGGNVLKEDIATSNGVIHVIDKVLFPPKGDLLDLVAQNPQLNTFMKAIEAAGLQDTLTSCNYYLN